MASSVIELVPAVSRDVEDVGPYPGDSLALEQPFLGLLERLLGQLIAR